MGRLIWLGGIFNMLVFLLFVLLSVAFTMNPSYADFDTDGGQTDRTTETLIRHMNIVTGRFPEMDGKKAQVQEQLANGKRPHEACSHCHIKGQDSGSAGQ